MSPSPPLTLREREAILRALASGLVPRLGLRHIQAGRAAEASLVLADIDRVAGGGAALRFVVGERGAGKTFLLNLVRLAALERGLVTIHADLAPDRRLQPGGGQARRFFAQAVRNMATRTRPEGGALASVVERFLIACVRQAEAQGGTVDRVIDERLTSLRAQVEDPAAIDDYAVVLKAYWQGSEDGNGLLTAAALRWLRGGYSTRPQTRQAVGAHTLVDDGGIADALKLLASFVRLAGYGGLFAVFDDMESLYGLGDAQARDENYGQILRMLEDMRPDQDAGHQTRPAIGLGIAFGGTPEVFYDTHRGLAGVPALRAGLPGSPIAELSGTVLRLDGLTPEDLRALLVHVRDVFACGDAQKHLVPDAALQAFSEHCARHLGAAWFRSPRPAVRSFVQFLGDLEQKPGTRWQDVLAHLPVIADSEAEDFEAVEPAPLPSERGAVPAS
ncbi:ATP-binding protein [Xanthobacter dioxanivorans]|uniref:ATP-binding protein n=1 Tax=Xanthobacter dioxanivorans TaxID=2528964 RepID=A0A974SG79_9HYPH|nr:BREX system ATP-binding domain-containing protein [Xanthobacter dioxanivorans]QRG04465.1 ATP-binding protein [Xanthobacter dioxanivorans]